ncbi:MAG: DUF2066 domain-containing protein [Gammaproteobacteria bacterium]|jgi:hypothetical protein
MHSFRHTTPSLRRLLFAVLACCGTTVQAVVVDNLYTATVERAADVADPRAAAQSAAMAEVLVRVSGNRMAATAPELAILRQNPARYIASFGYSSATEAQVSFLPREIERELIAAGWPVWGAERPLSILWVAVTDQFGDEAILTAGDPPDDVIYSEHMLELLAEIREQVESTAAVRGLPYILPTFVTGDDMRLSFGEVWTYAFGSLSDVSAAWEADAMVIGRVRESVIGTDVEWLVQSDSLRMSYPGAGVADGINWLADAYAEQYRSFGERHFLTLRVSGVGSFDSYARVLAYLESVTMLSDVDVESYRGGQLVLRATSRGDAQVLARTLSLDDVLREQNRLPGSGLAQTTIGATLDLVVVPERGVFGGFDAGL